MVLFVRLPQMFPHKLIPAALKTCLTECNIIHNTGDRDTQNFKTQNGSIHRQPINPQSMWCTSDTIDRKNSLSNTTPKQRQQQANYNEAASKRTMVLMTATPSNPNVTFVNEV